MNEEMIIGEMNELVIDRETPLGYMLTDGEYEVFMHKYQVIGDINVNDKIPVFLYIDAKKRLTATMQRPYITVTEADWVEVVSVDHDLGAFMNIGIVKDCLLSKDDLPYDVQQWPKVGERLFCRLRATESKMVAKIVSRFDIEKYIPKVSLLEVGKSVVATVIRIGEEGTSLMTEEGHHIFVYHKLRRGKNHIGEKIEVKVINSKSVREYNGTLIEQKEKMIGSDADVIKQYLIECDGEMPFTDKSAPDEIANEFGMSKAAFKRAIGNLLKQGTIEQRDGKTYLKQ